MVSGPPLLGVLRLLLARYHRPSLLIASLGDVIMLSVASLSSRPRNSLKREARRLVKSSLGARRPSQLEAEERRRRRHVDTHV